MVVTLCFRAFTEFDITVSGVQIKSGGSLRPSKGVITTRLNCDVSDSLAMFVESKGRS